MGLCALQVGQQSKAAMSMCLWVRAMDTYATVYRIVEPKRKILAEAQAALDASNAALAQKQAQLQAIKDKVAALQQQLTDTQKQLAALQFQASAHTGCGRVGRACPNSVKRNGCNMPSYNVIQCTVARALYGGCGELTSLQDCHQAHTQLRVSFA
jgi:multidrug efflux pump subunit AcrA (membrane-fusion protein)